LVLALFPRNDDYLHPIWPDFHSITGSVSFFRWNILTATRCHRGRSVDSFRLDHLLSRPRCGNWLARILPCLKLGCLFNRRNTKFGADSAHDIFPVRWWNRGQRWNLASDLIRNESFSGKFGNSVDNPKAFGIKGMRERAHAVGGWLDVSTNSHHGTSIILSIPLSKAQEVAA